MNVAHTSVYSRAGRILLLLAMCSLLAACVGSIFPPIVEWEYYDHDAALAAMKLPYREGLALRETAEKAVEIKLKNCLQQNQFPKIPDAQNDLVKLDACMKPYGRKNRWN